MAEPTDRDDGRTVALVATLIAAAAAVLLALLLSARREMWLDEHYTALLAGRPPGGMLRSLLGDTHPPVYYVVISLWRRLFGDSPLALRSLSILMHVLGGIAFLHVAHAILGRWSFAALGAALFLLSPGLLFHAAEARMYSTSALLVTIAIGAVWRQTEREQDGVRGAIATGALCALAFYTHYVTLFITKALILFWLGSVLVRRRGFRPWLAGALTFSAITAPWAPVLLRQMAGKRALSAAVEASWADPSAIAYGAQAQASIAIPNPIIELATNAISLLGVYPADRLPLLALGALPFAVLLLAAAWRTVRGSPAGVLVVTATLVNVAGCIVLGVLSRRYMLGLTPLLIVFLGLGLDEVRTRYGRHIWTVLAGTVLALTIAGAVRAATSRAHPSVTPIVERIQQGYRAGDLVVFNVLYGQTLFDYHAARMGFDPARRGFPETIYDWWDRQWYKGWGGPVIHDSDVTAFIDGLEREGVARLWLFQFETRYYDPRERLRAALGEHGWTVRPCDVRPDSPYALYLVTAAEDAAEPACDDAPDNRSGPP